jgi:hypothetical protein
MAAQPKLSQAQALRQQLEALSASLPQLIEAQGRAVLSGDAEEIQAARQAVQETEAAIRDLKAALPIAAAAEAEKLAGNRARIVERQRKRLELELKQLVKEALGITVHYANTVSAWLRLVRQAGHVRDQLFAIGHPNKEGWMRALAPLALHALAERELSRLGLPALSSEPLGMGLPAPGARPQPIYNHAPNLIPDLETTIRALAAAILQAVPGPRQEPQVSEEQADLPKVAEVAETVQGHSAAAAEPGETL